MKRFLTLYILALLTFAQSISAQVQQRVVDISTRPGVTQRFLLLAPDNPKAAVILFTGGHGGLQITPHGSFKLGEGNFLVRSRQLFVEQGLLTAVIDAPSDHQSPPFLGGFRQRPEHVADIKAVIAWLKRETKIQVWLIGTSRGTQSAAFIATQLAGVENGPDGVVLTSTMLTDDKGRPVPEMDLEKLRISVLVVHHKRDGCRYCKFEDLPRLMERLTAAKRKELITFDGGEDRGDPCEAFAYHGFNGLEREVVRRIAEWIIAR